MMGRYDLKWYRMQQHNHRFANEYRNLGANAKKVVNVIYTLSRLSMIRTRQWIRLAPNHLHMEGRGNIDEKLNLTYHYYTICAPVTNKLREEIASKMSESSLNNWNVGRLLCGIFTMGCRAGICGEMADSVMYFLIRGIMAQERINENYYNILKKCCLYNVRYEPQEHNLAQITLGSSVDELKAIMAELEVEEDQRDSFKKCIEWYVDPWYYQHPVAVVDTKGKSEYYNNTAYLSHGLRKKYEQGTQNPEKGFNVYAKTPLKFTDILESHSTPQQWGTARDLRTALNQLWLGIGHDDSWQNVLTEVTREPRVNIDRAILINKAKKNMYAASKDKDAEKILNWYINRHDEGSTISPGIKPTRIQIKRYERMIKNCEESMRLRNSKLRSEGKPFETEEDLKISIDKARKRIKKSLANTEKVLADFISKSKVLHEEIFRIYQNNRTQSQRALLIPRAANANDLLMRAPKFKPKLPNLGYIRVSQSTVS